MIASADESASRGDTGAPPVLVTRVIPEAGLRLVREACAMDLWEDPLPPPRPILLERVGRKAGHPLAPDGPGRR